MSPGTQPHNPVFKDAPPTPVIRDFTVTNPDTEPDQSWLTRKYTEESLVFIRRHAGKRPFFLYVAHTMPHVPLFAGRDFAGHSRRGLYGDTIEEIDWSAGRVLETLKQLGVDENTLVVFTSDNGPWLSQKLDGGSAGPFFEGKVSTWEGGFRVPAIFRWPGKIEAGVTTTAFGTTMDLFTTFILLGGGTLPSDRDVDGQDLSPVLLQKKPGREPLLYYYFADELWGVRKGPWKMHFKTTDPASVTTWGAWEIEERDPPILFNVDHDPGEKYNLGASNPDIVAELTALAQGHREKLKPGAPQR